MEYKIDSTELNPSEMDALHALLQGKKMPLLVNDDGKSKVKLPASICRLLLRVIMRIKEGRNLILLCEDEVYTTQAAARFLGMSRQHLVNTLEDGKIPFHKVGTHRRVYLKDLILYKEQRDQFRKGN